MKTSININLCGTVYAIDQDAHQLLDQYLNSLKHYFGKQPGGDEIIDDIEHRIAEHFWMLKQQGTESITIEQVTEIMHRIGNPEEMDQQAETANADDTQQHTQGEHTESHHTSTGSDAPRFDAAAEQAPRGSRRYYRDGSDKLLGGVLSGVCHYLGWKDPIVLRLLFVLLCWLTDGILVFIYLLLWAIAPKAITTEERLRMQGKPVNAETLRSQVIDDTTAVQAGATGNSNGSGCLKGLLLAFLAPFGCLATFVVFITIMTLFGIGMGLFGALAGILGGGQAEIVGLFHGERFTFLIIALCVVAGITLPIYALYRWLRRDRRPFSQSTLITVAGLWLIAIIVGWSYGNRLQNKIKAIDWSNISFDLDFDDWDSSDVDVTWTPDDDDADNLSGTKVSVNPFDVIHFEGVGNVKFSQDSVCTVRMKGKEAQMRKMMISSEDGTLNIEYKQGNNDASDKNTVKIYITAPCLSALTIKGVGAFEMLDTLRQTQPIAIDFKGVGSFEANCLACPKVTLNQQGVGKSDITVDTDSLLVKSEGVGKAEIAGRATHYMHAAGSMLSHIDDQHLIVGQ